MRELGCWSVSSDLNMQPFLDMGWRRLSDKDVETMRKQKLDMAELLKN